MELVVRSLTQQDIPPLMVSDDVFSCPFKEGLIHQVVHAYLAGGRSGNRAQKTRSEVRGGGAKPWRQKGTGRARAGTIRSPLWRTGGVTFAAKPRDFSQKVNRKMYQRALASIFSELVRQDRLIVVDELTIKEPKTRQLKDHLDALNFKKGLILIRNIGQNNSDTHENEARNLALSSRNLVGVNLDNALTVNPVSLVVASHILVTVEAIKQIEKRIL